MDYNDLLEIDLFALDLEWQRQPSLYIQVSEKASEAFQKFTELKDFFNVREAEISLEYRLGKKIMEDSEGKPMKITDKAVDSMLGANSELDDIKKQMREQKKIYDDASALITAIEHKKKALENEVSLYLSGYFSEPREKRIIDETQKRDISDYTSDQQKQKLNEKRIAKEAGEEPTPRRRRRRNENSEEVVF